MKWGGGHSVESIRRVFGSRGEYYSIDEQTGIAKRKIYSPSTDGRMHHQFWIVVDRFDDRANDWSIGGCICVFVSYVLDHGKLESVGVRAGVRKSSASNWCCG
jgi:hypothetical protein